MSSREIKFRAWNDVKKRMEYDVYKEYQNLMQFTGLTDRTGKPIYEADHLYAEGNLGGEDYIGTVKYCTNDAKYVVETLHGRLEWIPNNDCWVKGNVYEGESNG